MDGDFDDLCYVCLDAIKYGLDSTSIPIIKALMQDPSGIVRGWAVECLLYMAENDDNLKRKIQDIIFPIRAVNDAKSFGVEIPPWVKIKSDKKN